MKLLRSTPQWIIFFLGIVLLAAGGAVFLVLTGIIAEPETMLLDIFRFLFG